MSGAARTARAEGTASVRRAAMDWIVAEAKLDDGLIRNEKRRAELWADKSKYVTAETGILRYSGSRLIRNARRAGIAPALVDGTPLPPLAIKWPPNRDQIPEGYLTAADEMHC